MGEERTPRIRHALGTAGQPPQEGLARDLSELAREMQAAPSMADLLRRIVDAAVAEIRPAGQCGIMEVHHGEVSTRAMTGPLVERIDRLQYEVQDGPCLSSLRTEATVRCDDLAHETRWPRFAARAAEQGVRSMLSVQLFVEGDNLGALNLYAADPGVLTEEHESVAMLLASHAAIAMKGSRVEADLRTALATRDVIGQAKGILMERFKIDQTQAFDLLVLASQRTHVKLNALAEELARSGELRTELPQG